MTIDATKLAKLIEETILRDLFNGDEDYRSDAKSVAADVCNKIQGEV